MYCGKCGRQLPDEAQFCWKCGVAIGNAGSAAPLAPAIVQLTCPKCAGRLAVSPDLNKLTCGSCGSELLIVRDDKTVTLKLGTHEQALISALASPPAPKEKTCPACGRVDQVQAVTALVGAHSDVAHGSPATVQKLRLAVPKKADPTLLKVGVLFFVAGALIGLSVRGVSATTGLVLLLLGCASLIGSVAIYSRQKQQYRQAVDRRDVVRRIWQTLNYCHRCDRVFVPGTTTMMTPDEMEHRLYSQATA